MFHLTELNSTLYPRKVKPLAPEEAVTECTEMLCGKANRSAHKVKQSIGMLCVCECVFVCVCFNGLHKFTVYETNAGGFVRLSGFAFLKRKINQLSLRNTSQLYVGPSVCQYI
jgi:hypothetical protein